MAIVILTAESFAALHGLAQRVARLNAKNPEIGAGMLADLVERASSADRPKRPAPPVATTARSRDLWACIRR